MAESYHIAALVNGFRQILEIKTPVEKSAVERLTRLTYTPLGGIYVCHHVPTDPDGSRDFYNLFRNQNPGMTAYVGYTVFETDSIPEPWVDACNAMDAIWVPSHFNVETFSRAGVMREKLHVIPHGFDPQEYRAGETGPLQIGQRRGFNFLSIFEWTYRKGWDVLVKAYLDEFSQEEDVRLILRAYQGGGVIGEKKKSVIEQLSDYITELGHDPENIPEIEFIDYMVPSELMPSLYKAADCFVMPTRGEGWGIPFTESMLMEVPVIATRWSGHLEFMNDENSYLIDVDETVPVDEEQVKDSPFYAGHRWANPSKEHTRRLMRHVFENRAEARTKGREARQHILNHFTTHHAAAKIAACCMDLESRALRGGSRGKKLESGSDAAHSRAARLPDRSGRLSAKPTAESAESQGPVRVLFCARPSMLYDPRDDTHIALQLKVELERRGVIVDLSTFPDTDLERYDLVHIFCMDESFGLNAAMRKRPFLVTPNRWSSAGCDAEATRIIGSFMDFLDSRDWQALEEDLLDITAHPTIDNPFDLEFLYSQAEAVFVTGLSEWKHLFGAFPGIRRMESLTVGFDRLDILGRVTGDLFVSKFGVEDFVLCVGPLEALRNQLMLMYALRRDDIPLVFADSDCNNEAYEKLCRKFARGNNTIFTGKLDERMLASAYRAAKVIAHVGWTELPGLASLQGSWLGLNVVVSRTGTARDCFKGNAIYCDPLDADSIREAVLTGLNRAKERRRPDFLDGHDWNTQTEKILSIYREVLKECRTEEGALMLERKALLAQEELIYQQSRVQAFEALQRKQDKAYEIARHLADMKPRDPLLQYIMGSFCLQESRFQQAERHFRKCLEFKPSSNIKGYFCLFLSLMKQDRYEDAQDVLLKGIELHPQVPVETQALMFEYLKRSSKGVAKARAAGRRKNARNRAEIFQPLLQLAREYCAEGRTAKAVQYVAEALKLAPHDKEVIAMAKELGIGFGASEIGKGITLGV
ncbi:MAG: glycosyltransferase family 4 protein [Planctomycetota bacterium]|jgi:glycosyltransferase involved in cell wall biosynthesis/Tfp pilus assembly protein PilF